MNGGTLVPSSSRCSERCRERGAEVGAGGLVPASVGNCGPELVVGQGGDPWLVGLCLCFG